MRREHLQPHWINGRDVTHVHALGVHDLRVEEVGRLLLCEEGAGGMDLEPGLAIKNPPKKTHSKKPTQKTHLKTPLKMFFLGF